MLSIFTGMMPGLRRTQERRRDDAPPWPDVPPGQNIARASARPVATATPVATRPGTMNEWFST